MYDLIEVGGDFLVVSCVGFVGVVFLDGWYVFVGNIVVVEVSVVDVLGVGLVVGVG